ncbi:MAG: hypothetical protein ACYCVY_13265 [Acidiferrobacteraceae bacterium]
MPEKEGFDIESFWADPKNQPKVSMFKAMVAKTVAEMQKEKQKTKTSGFLSELFGDDPASVD